MQALTQRQLPSNLFNYYGEERRIRDLELVLRFDQAKHVIHRNNLHTHMLRVGYISLDLAQHLRTTYDVAVNPTKTYRLARYHDDPEVITGDIPTPIKYALKPTERKKLQQAEHQAAQELAERYFGINLWKKTQYLRDQKTMTDKETPEARVVNIADKMEGLCETIHELRCGNQTFVQILNNYRSFFAKFIVKEPLFTVINADTKYKMTLRSIPTVEAVMKLQPIHHETFHKNPERFWQEVFDEHLPSFYKQWLAITMQELGPQALFPGWKEIK